MSAAAGTRRAARLLTAGLVIGSIWTAASAGPPPRPGSVAITDVAIVDVEHARTLGPRTVLIDSGRIAAIRAPDAPIPADAVRVDGRGKFLMPGLVDMHVHLFNKASQRPPNDWSLPLYVALGVTAVREMNADAAGLETIRRWRRETADGERIAPHVLAAGIAVFGSATPAQARRDAEAAVDAGADFIKVFSEVPAAHWRAILEVARQRAKPVAGHVPAGVPLREAAAAGQRSNEHLMQAYEACSSIEKALIDARGDLEGAALVGLRDAQEARALAAFAPRACARTGRVLAKANLVQVPTLVLPHMEATRPNTAPDADPRWRYLRADERVRWRRIAADLDARADAQAGLRWQVSRRIVSAFQRAGVTILAGTDAPMPYVYPGFALHDELALLVEAGLTPAEALNAATLAPAKFLGLAATSGSIAVGKTADLVLLDADPLRDIGHTRRIDAVLLGGRLLRRADLDALLEVAANAQQQRH